MKGPAIADLTRGTGPLVATAIHAGSFMRRSLIQYCKLDRIERLREEDPFTEHLAQISDNMIIGQRSRFEVDLNRPRAKAVYLRPEDAWDLDVWHELPSEEIELSLGFYDSFYEEVDKMMSALFREHERIIVLDIHSYNHQREGEGLFADPMKNPEVNIGTGNLDRNVWGGVVEVLMERLRTPLLSGEVLDVRENVKFKGGYFSEWLYTSYGKRICPIAIEFKKIFMNEWTSVPDMLMVEQFRRHLEHAAATLMHTIHGSATA